MQIKSAIFGALALIAYQEAHAATDGCISSIKCRMERWGTQCFPKMHFYARRFDGTRVGKIFEKRLPEGIDSCPESLDELAGRLPRDNALRDSLEHVVAANNAKEHRLYVWSCRGHRAPDYEHRRSDDQCTSSSLLREAEELAREARRKADDERKKEWNQHYHHEEKHGEFDHGHKLEGPLKDFESRQTFREDKEEAEKLERKTRVTFKDLRKAGWWPFQR